MEMQDAGTQPWSDTSPGGGFVGAFQAAVARHAGIRMTLRNEFLVRAAVASVLRRAHLRGAIPRDTRLLAIRAPGRMTFRVVSDAGVIAEAFVDGRPPRRTRRRKGH